jgi:stage III sporulation protein SpoIIIAA
MAMKTDLTRKVRAENDRIASRLRERFARAGTFVLNLISAPGSGKTTLLEATARTLGNGRVVVLANMPMLASSTWQGSPVYANAAGTFLRNALLWVSHQIRWRPRPAE